MADYRIVTGEDVDQQALNAFLDDVYAPAKSRFIAQHGGWLYRGRENQWVVVDGDQIVAYCAVIPVTCRVGQRDIPALWWVDLIVAPPFRGQGIQSLIDAKMRAETDLKLGIPNALAAKIHRKHGWGVREDGHVLLLPLRPYWVNAVQRASGMRGVLLRAAAGAATPLVRLALRRRRRYQPQSARRLERVRPALLADIFARVDNGDLVTITRDRAFLQWRYLDAPYHDQLWCYVAGPNEAPTHYLIARRVDAGNAPAVRVLDWYGPLSQPAEFRDLLSLLIRDAMEIEAAQATVMSFLPDVTQLAEKAGFRLKTTARFCWHSTDQALFTAMSTGQYWTIGDSDNDAPI